MLTVGIPCYRMSEHLPCLLQSIRKQTYPNIEVIVADDGSPKPDDFLLEQEAKNWGVGYIRTENKGLWNVYNALTAAAGNAYVLLLDNDVAIPPVFADHLRFFLDSNHVGVVGVAAAKMTERQSWSFMAYPVPVLGESKVELATQLAGYCFAFKKYVWEDLGGFTPGYHFYLQDSDFCCKAALHGYPSYRLHYPKPWHVEHATLDVHKELQAKELLTDDLLLFQERWNDTPTGTEKRLLRKIGSQTVHFLDENGRTTIKVSP